MTDDRFRLDGRVAVVLGGGGALGRAISVGFSEAGASLVVADRDESAEEATLAQIHSKGGQGFAQMCDHTKPEQVDSLFAAVDSQFGRVDILVNAVTAPVERFEPEDFPLDAWDRMLATNLTGVLLSSQAAGRRMIDQKRGSIINLGSIASVSALGRGSLAYSASKGGVGQLTREMAYAWARHGVRVNALLPCQFVNAGLAQMIADPAKGDLVDRIVSGIPIGRMGSPDEIVGPAIFLASDASAMVTGVLLPVDGGNLAMNAGGSLEW
jgi:NAD(P)-dependent dehydrogenase (short-subunit alcohol dehydrogenase family)